MIEKLGITSIIKESKSPEEGIKLSMSFKDVRGLEQQRDEVLEALIDMEKDSCEFCDDTGYQKELCGKCKHAVNKSIIEKATGKTWPEIKELIND